MSGHGYSSDFKKQDKNLTNHVEMWIFVLKNQTPWYTVIQTKK